MDFRDLPSVDALAIDLAAESPAVARPVLQAIARDVLDQARSSLEAGEEPDVRALGMARVRQTAGLRPQRVINATGVLLHTNLGRAIVAPDSAAAAATQATGYGNVELDLFSGKRGGRGAYLNELLGDLTGAEAALAVNNNAGALVLALAALAGDGGVAVSRGELIEIGGSFRLPDLMNTSGAHLVEVGTTNRTRLADYSGVIDSASLVLKVHPSNYRIEGFTAEVSWADLAVLATKHHVPYVADVGSGLLDTRTPWLKGTPPSWLAGEPGVRQVLDAGADVVLFSGDKLLGGPQAGIAVGNADLISAMKRHPLARALRIDGPTQAALVATVEFYAAGNGEAIPFWRMASLDYDALAGRHGDLLRASGVSGSVVGAESTPGAGSVPGATIPSPAIQVEGDADAHWAALARWSVPIIGRRKDQALLLDLRTVDEADDEIVVAALEGLS